MGAVALRVGEGEHAAFGKALWVAGVGLVVRLDERDAAGAAGLVVRGHPSEERGGEALLRRPAGVGDDEVNAVEPFGEFGVERVGAFHDGNARVSAKGPGELAIGGVDGVDASGTGLEQAVGEAAGGAAKVGAGQACDVEGEGVEGVAQLEPAAADEGFAWGDGLFEGHRVTVEGTGNQRPAPTVQAIGCSTGLSSTYVIEGMPTMATPS